MSSQNTVFHEMSIYLSGLLIKHGLTNANFTMFDIEQIQSIQSSNPAMQLTATGLFNSPNDISTMTLGGERKMTVFRTWYVRFNFRTFQNRVDNEEYIEQFEKMLWNETMDGNLPVSEKRRYESFDQTGSAYPYQKAEDGAWADYAFNFRIVYYD